MYVDKIPEMGNRDFNCKSELVFTVRVVITPPINTKIRNIGDTLPVLRFSTPPIVLLVSITPVTELKVGVKLTEIRIAVLNRLHW